MVKEEKSFVGLHSIVEFSSCDLRSFCLEQEDTKKIIDTWVGLLNSINVQTLGTHAHFFGPNSISLSLNLSESHLNFHTWPEYDYVAFDYFCCKKDEKLKSDMETLIEETGKLFKSKDIKSIWVLRQYAVSF